MWVFVIILMLLAMLLCFIYLVNRIYKFQSGFHRIKWKKPIKIAISVAIVIGVFTIISLSIGAINAMICLLHLAAFWLLSDLIIKLINTRKKKAIRSYIAGIAAFVFTCAYLSMGWYLANHVWETNYSIDTTKNIGSLRIIQFADSHIGTTFSGEELSKYVTEMQSLNPDVVLITGDYIDDDTSKEDMINACKSLGGFKTTYGVYYVFGNHDKGYYKENSRGYKGYNDQDLMNELECNGVTVLQDESILVDNRFYIIGRNDRSENKKGTKRKEISELIQGLDQSKYMIVMDHQPHDYKNEAAAKVDLVLSGHTHGGQFIPFNGLGSLTRVNDMTYGLKKNQSTNFIVTSGISDWALRFKTGCKSEFVVIDISEKES